MFDDKRTLTCNYMAMQLPIPFEIHITVGSLLTSEQENFVQVCRQYDAKPLLIELAKGDFMQQPMLTKVLYTTTLGIALQNASNYSTLLEQAGFIANRVKIEIPADCAKAYKDDTQYSFTKYFEWHGKIDYINTGSLLALCSEHKVHLSVNALKNDPGTRFITLREFGNYAVFMGRIASLANALQAGGWNLTKQQAEYCIYDTNQLLDNGWLPQ